MNLFLTLVTLVLGVITLVSVVTYLSRRAKYRMNLQDLRLHGKPHRTLTQAERDELAGQTASLQRIQGSGGMSYEPVSDSVYLVSGGTASDGLELRVQSIKHVSIAKKFTVVIGLNGHRLAQ